MEETAKLRSSSSITNNGARGSWIRHLSLFRHMADSHKQKALQHGVLLGGKKI